MKILFIHEVDYLAKVIYEIHEFPEHLASRGYDVSFIDFPEALRKPNWSAKKRSRLIQGRVLPNVTLRLLSPFVPNGGVLGRLVATLTFIPALLRQISQNRPDVIALYAVPTYGWQTIFLSRLAGIPVLYRALDVSHEINKSVFNPIIKLAEKYVYKNADVLSANNEFLAKYCVDMGMRTQQTLVNLPPVDLEAFGQAPGAETHITRTSLGIGEQSQVICYMGSFFYFSGLPQALKRFSLKLQNNPNLIFLLVGGGEQDVELRELVDSLGISANVVFTGFVPFGDLPAYLKLADVAVNTMEVRQVSNLALPHKVIQYMAAGIPVVSTRLRGLESVFGDVSGITWAADSQDSIDRAVQLLLCGKSDQICALQMKAVHELFEMDSVLGSFMQALVAAVELVGRDKLS